MAAPMRGIETAATAAAPSILKTFCATSKSTAAAATMSKTRGRRRSHPTLTKTTSHAAPAASLALNNPAQHSNYHLTKASTGSHPAQTWTESTACPALKSTPNAENYYLTNRARRSNTTAPATTRPSPKSCPFRYLLPTYWHPSSPPSASYQPS